MEFKHIMPPLEFLNESRRPIEAQKVTRTTKDIKVFKTNTSFNIPIDDSSHIASKPGTTLICFEDEVFINQNGTYIKALFETKFLEMNKKMFDKVEL
jgi:hypothetical protein